MVSAANLGTGGSALDAQYGNGSTVSTYPTLLTHTGESYLYLPGVAGNFVSIPDAGELDITGDIEIVARVALDDWTPSTTCSLVGKSIVGSISYELRLTASGSLSLLWSQDGTTGNTPTSTVAVPFTDGQAGWVRVTRVQSSGIVRFYTAADSASEPSVWTQLGADVVSLAGTAIFAGTSQVEIGSRLNGTVFLPVGKFFRAIIRNGIGGTAVLDLNFTTGITANSQAWVPLSGQTVPVALSSQIVNLGYGGSALNAQFGSGIGADTLEPMLLTHSGTNYLYVTGLTGNYASLPDATPLDIPGDIDVRVRVALDDWGNGSTNQTLAAKWNDLSPNRSWLFRTTSTGALQFSWSPDGAAFTSISPGAIPPLVDGYTYWLRVTFDVDNGASGSQARFYWAADSTAEPSSWTELTAPTPGVGTTSLYPLSNALTTFGARNSGLTDFATGKFFRATVRDGIGGTVVADVNFTTGITSGAQTSFVESSVNTATVSILRAGTGRKSVAVVKPTLLFGTNDYFEVPDNALLDFEASDSFTVVAAVRQWGTPVSTGAMIAKASGSGASVRGWRLRNGLGTPAESRFEIADGTIGESVATGQNTVSGLLAVHAAVRNTATDVVQLTTNNIGGVSSTDDTTTTLANAEVVRVGRFSGAGTSYIDMEFYGAAIFRRALTSSEIQIINDYYQNGLTTQAEALLKEAVWWIDPAMATVPQINRSATGRQAVAVAQQTWVLGTDDYFEVADSALNDFGANDSFTVVAVVRFWGTIANNSIIGKSSGNISATMQGYQMFFSGGAPSFRLGDGATRVGGVSVTTATSGNLAVYSFHRDVALDRVWAERDGIETSGRTTDTTTGTLANAEKLYVGGQAATGFSNCELLGVLLFRGSLTAAEIDELVAYYSTPVAITTQPSNVSAAAGTTAFFVVGATGEPSPTYQWQVSTNGGTIFTSIVGATMARLSLANVQLSQSGYKYRAIVTNPGGSVKTNAATLTVT